MPKCIVIASGNMSLDLRGTQLGDLEYVDIQKTPDYEIYPGVRYILLHNDKADYQSYDWVTSYKKIHLGPRGEKFYECSLMDYLKTRSGYIFKCVYPHYDWTGTWIESEAQFRAMEKNLDKIKEKLRGARLKQGVSKKSGKPWFRLEYQVLSDRKVKLADYLNNDNYLTEDPKLSYLKFIRSNEDIDKAFNYLINYQGIFGLDYETCGGFPFDSPNFDWMGVSIVTDNGNAAYFDIEYMQHVGGNFEHFKDRYREFLEKRAEVCITYNCSFEMRATYLMLGKIYYFGEGSTSNIVDGFNRRRFSLKWTAMRRLHVASWDDDFERLSEDFQLMMLGEVGKKGVKVTEPYTLENYKESEIWKRVASEFPDDIPEFDRLIARNWGDPFGCIPARILGSYCSLDSFYTVLLRKTDYDSYTEKCVSCYENNKRFAALLGIYGIELDIKHRDYLGVICLNLVNSSRTKIAQFWLSQQMEMMNIPELGKGTVVNLLKQGYDPFSSRQWLRELLSDEDYGVKVNTLKRLMQEDEVQFVLETIRKHFGNLGKGSFRSATAFNEIDEFFISRYEMSQPSEYQVEFTSTIGDVVGHISLDFSVDEIIGYFKNVRQYAEIEILSKQIYYDDKVHKYVVLDLSGTLGGKVVSGEQYLTEETKGYKILKSMGYDPLDGWCRLITSEELVDYCAQIINLQSPYVAEDISFALLLRYLDVANMICHQKDGSMGPDLLDVEPPKYPMIDHYENLNHAEIELVMDDYLYLMEFARSIINEYPDVIFDEDASGLPENASDKIRLMRDNWVKSNRERKRKYELLKDPLKIMWEMFKTLEKSKVDPSKFKSPEFVERFNKFRNILTREKIGLIPMYQTLTPFLDWVSYGWVQKSTPELKEVVINDFWDLDTSKVNLRSFLALILCDKIHKKYAKVYGTYLLGHFGHFNEFVNDPDENLISTERFHTGDVHQFDHQKAYFPYQELSCSSKRWSGPWHTIPSCSEMKQIVRAPKGHLIVYRDISGAEVRGISYLAPSVNPDGTIDPTKRGDQYMVDCYSRKVDPYINMAQQIEPGRDAKFYKQNRGKYKAILLGALYGMGPAALADSAGISEEEAINSLDQLFSRMRGIAKMRKDKGRFCVEHEGEIETLLGDKLIVGYEPDRWERLGINQCVQNFSAVALGDGFFNEIYQSNQPDSPVRPLVPIGIIHDSSQSYFRASDIFKIYAYLRNSLTEYLKGKYFGLEMLFDLEVGKTFYDVCHLKDIDEHTLKLSGNYKSINGILIGLEEDNTKYKITSFHDNKNDKDIEIVDNKPSAEFKPHSAPTYVEQFINDGNDASFDKDDSDYTVIIEEIVD